MLTSFTDELHKIAFSEIKANSNVVKPMKSGLGDMGSNIMGKPLSSPGINTSATKAGPAKGTNYSMVNSTTPTAANNVADASKSVPPPPV